MIPDPHAILSQQQNYEAAVFALSAILAVLGPVFAISIYRWRW